MKIIYRPPSPSKSPQSQNLTNIIADLGALNHDSAVNLPECCLFNPKYSQTAMEEFRKISKPLKKSTLIIVIGIGGSVLGLQSLLQIYPPENSQVIILDSVNTITLEAVKSQINKLKSVEEFCLIIISKSGSTVETTFNYLQVLKLLQTKFKKSKLKKVYSRIIAITKKNSKLSKHVLGNSGKVIDHPQALSGRFSILSVVGVLPLEIINSLDVQRLLSGAILAREDFFKSKSVTLNNIIIHKSKLASRGICINDYFIFDPLFENLGKWLRQLIAESLGKEGLGLFPTVSIGSVDLHSMFQYYLGGNFPSFSEFILVKPKHKFDKLNYFAGKSAIDAFGKHGKDYLQITFEERSEFEFGYFIQYKIIETIVIGKLLEVNVFDQPMVEQYKKYLEKYLK